MKFFVTISDRIELTRLTGIIYEIINSLICNADREPNPSAIKLLFKCLLPKILASSLDTRNANVSKFIIRDDYKKQEIPTTTCLEISTDYTSLL